MKQQTILKNALCLLMALVCNVAWAQTPEDAWMSNRRRGTWGNLWAVED